MKPIINSQNQKHAGSTARHFAAMIKRLNQLLLSSSSSNSTKQKQQHQQHRLHMKTAAELVTPGLVAGRSQLLLQQQQQTANTSVSFTSGLNKDTSLLADINLSIASLSHSALKQSSDTPYMLSKDLDRFIPVVAMLPVLKELLDRAERNRFFSSRNQQENKKNQKEEEEEEEEEEVEDQQERKQQEEWEQYVLEHVTRDELKKFADNFLAFASATPSPELSLHCLRLLHQFVSLHSNLVSPTLFPQLLVPTSRQQHQLQAATSLNQRGDNNIENNKKISALLALPPPLLSKEQFLQQIQQVAEKGKRLYAHQPYNKRILIGQIFSALVGADIQMYYQYSSSSSTSSSADAIENENKSPIHKSMFLSSSTKHASNRNQQESSDALSNPLVAHNHSFSFYQNFDLWLHSYPLAVDNSSSSSSPSINSSPTSTAAGLVSDLEAQLSMLCKTSMMTLTMLRNYSSLQQQQQQQFSSKIETNNTHINNNNDLNNELVWNQKPPSNYILGLLMFLNEAKSFESVLKFFRHQLEKRGFTHVCYLDSDEGKKAVEMREEVRKRLLQEQEERKNSKDDNIEENDNSHHHPNQLIKLHLPEFQIRAAQILTLRIARLSKKLPQQQHQHQQDQVLVQKKDKQTTKTNEETDGEVDGETNNNLLEEEEGGDEVDTNVVPPAENFEENNKNTNTNSTTASDASSSSFDLLLQGSTNAETIASALNLWVDYVKAMAAIDRQQELHHQQQQQTATTTSKDNTKNDDESECKNEKEEKSSPSPPPSSLVKNFLHRIQPRTLLFLLKVIRFYSSPANKHFIKNHHLMVPVTQRFDEVLRFCVRNYASDFVDLTNVACQNWGATVGTTKSTQFLTHPEFFALFTALEKFAKKVSLVSNDADKSDDGNKNDHNNNNDKNTKMFSEERRKIHVLFRQGAVFRLLAKAIDMNMLVVRESHHRDGLTEVRNRFPSRAFAERQILSAMTMKNTQEEEDKNVTTNEKESQNEEEQKRKKQQDLVESIEQLEQRIYIEEHRRVLRIKERREILTTILTAISDQLLHLPQHHHFNQLINNPQNNNTKQPDQQQQQQQQQHPHFLHHRSLQSTASLIIRTDMELLKWCRSFVLMQFDHAALNYVLSKEILRFLKEDNIVVRIDDVTNNINNMDDDQIQQQQLERMISILESRMGTLILRNCGLLMKVIGLGMSSSSSLLNSSSTTATTDTENGDENNDNTKNDPEQSKDHKQQQQHLAKMLLLSSFASSPAEIEQIHREAYELLLTKMQILSDLRRKANTLRYSVMRKRTMDLEQQEKEKEKEKGNNTEEEEADENDDEEEDFSSPSAVFTNNNSPQNFYCSPAYSLPSFSLTTLVEFLRGHHLANLDTPRDFRHQFLIPYLVKAINVRHKNSHNTIAREFTSKKKITNLEKSEVYQLDIPQYGELLSFADNVIQVVTVGFLSGLIKVSPISVAATILNQKSPFTLSSSTSSAPSSNVIVGGPSTEMSIVNVYKSLCYAVLFIFQRDYSEMNVDKIDLLWNYTSSSSSLTDTKNNTSTVSSANRRPNLRNHVLSSMTAAEILRLSVVSSTTTRTNPLMMNRHFNSFFQQQMRISVKILSSLALRMNFNSPQLRFLRLRMESRIASFIQLSLREVLRARLEHLIEEEERKLKQKNNSTSSFLLDQQESSSTSSTSTHRDLLAVQQQPQMILTKLLSRVALKISSEIDSVHESGTRFSVSVASRDRYSDCAIDEERALIADADVSVPLSDATKFLQNKLRDSKNNANKRRKQHQQEEENNASKTISSSAHHDVLLENPDHHHHQRRDGNLMMTHNTSDKRKNTAIPRLTMNRAFYFRLQPLRIKCVLMTLHAVITMQPPQVLSNSPSASSLLVSNLWSQDFISKSLSSLASSPEFFAKKRQLSQNNNNKFQKTDFVVEQYHPTTDLVHRIVFLFVKNATYVDRLNIVGLSSALLKLRKEAKTNANNNDSTKSTATSTTSSKEVDEKNNKNDDENADEGITTPEEEEEMTSTTSQLLLPNLTLLLQTSIKLLENNPLYQFEHQQRNTTSQKKDHNININDKDDRLITDKEEISAWQRERQREQESLSLSSRTPKSEEDHHIDDDADEDQEVDVVDTNDDETIDKVSTTTTTTSTKPSILLTSPAASNIISMFLEESNHHHHEQQKKEEKTDDDQQEKQNHKNQLKNYVHHAYDRAVKNLEQVISNVEEETTTNKKKKKKNKSVSMMEKMVKRDLKQVEKEKEELISLIDRLEELISCTRVSKGE